MISYFIAIDGDDVGPSLRNFIIRNDVEGASNYSENLKKFFIEVSEILIDQGAEIIFIGGDSVLAEIEKPLDASELKNLYFGPCTISIGIGATSEIAYLALQLAKARGKNQAVLIDEINHSTVFKNF